MNEHVNRFIVLENGKPAILPDSAYDIWKRCIFRTDEEAVNYAVIWCGRIIEGRKIETRDWFQGVDVSQTEDKVVISISVIQVPS